VSIAKACIADVACHAAAQTTQDPTQRSSFSTACLTLGSNGDVHLLAAQTTQDPSQPSNFSTKEQLIVDNMCLTVHPPAAGSGT